MAQAGPVGLWQGSGLWAQREPGGPRGQETSASPSEPQNEESPGVRQGLSPRQTRCRLAVWGFNVFLVFIDIIFWAAQSKGIIRVIRANNDHHLNSVSRAGKERRSRGWGGAAISKASASVGLAKKSVMFFP